MTFVSCSFFLLLKIFYSLIIISKLPMSWCTLEISISHTGPFLHCTVVSLLPENMNREPCLRIRRKKTVLKFLNIGFFLRIFVQFKQTTAIYSPPHTWIYRLENGTFFQVDFFLPHRNIMSINAKIALCIPQRKMCLIKQIFSCLSKIQSEKKSKGQKTHIKLLLKCTGYYTTVGHLLL